MKVLGTVMTSSPGPTPSASRANQRASVPLPFALIGLVVNLISDLVYTWVDPRIDFETREV